MLNLHSLSFVSAANKRLLLSFVYAALILFLSSCSANIPVQRENDLTAETMRATNYSLVFVIHGDGDYFYHDADGNRYKADEEALTKAKKIAQQNPGAEVFIFHSKPARRFMFLFPLKDGEFYYYRNGQLIANESYWRDQELSNFDIEVELYRRFSSQSRNEKVNMFLYFGHEIPEFSGEGYDDSYPDRSFTVRDLAVCLKSLTRDFTMFDLMILSTCYGGTPYTIGKLGLFAQYIIASPENLHLSYFDLSLLEMLDLNLHERDVYTFAKRFAKQAFDRLTMDVETAVSVAVYDVDLIKKYLNPIQLIYENSLIPLRENKLSYLTMVEHCDCADITAYNLPTINNGVEVFYRPARFGRLKFKQNHSGWECWKNIEP